MSRRSVSNASTNSLFICFYYYYFISFICHNSVSTMEILESSAVTKNGWNKNWSIAFFLDQENIFEETLFSINLLDLVSALVAIGAHEVSLYATLLSSHLMNANDASSVEGFSVEGVWKGQRGVRRGGRGYEKEFQERRKLHTNDHAQVLSPPSIWNSYTRKNQPKEKQRPVLGFPPTFLKAHISRG